MQLENEQDRIVFENAAIRREITFRYGKPIHSVIIRRDSGYRWETKKEEPLLVLPGFDWTQCETSFADDMVLFESNYTVRWVFTVGEDAPYIRSQLYIKGTCDTAENETSPDVALISGGVELSPVSEAADAGQTEVIDRVYHSGRHGKLHRVTFFDCTDHCNSLLREDDTVLYHTETACNGSLFFFSDPTVGEVCMVCKDAPVGAAHLHRPAADCRASSACLSVSGSGIDYHALSADYFTAGYSVTIAVCRTGLEKETSRLCYADACGGFSPYIMSNTWGDRSQDRALSESFIHAEILRAEQMGVDIVQIDDGWQTGRSANSALSKSSVWNCGYYDADPDFWVPDAAKFPAGFGALCDFAYSHNVALGLWFSPDAADHYQNWRRDADVLLDFYRVYGIRHFKLDGVQITTKLAEKRFLRMCYTVYMESEGRVNFQMDITNGSRLGYFYEKGLGTLFVENRYTDWGNYYPHDTLRNLWQTAQYIPAGKLQFEVLNLRRNTENYTGDPLAPDGYSIAYVFASVMVSNPLIWAELQHLTDEDAAEVAALIEIYRLYRDDFVEVIPVGDCPDGYAITGFEIRGGQHDYYIGIRELSERDTVHVPVQRILATNDPELITDGDRIIFSDVRKYFFAIL